MDEKKQDQVVFELSFAATMMAMNLNDPDIATKAIKAARAAWHDYQYAQTELVYTLGWIRI